VVAWLASWLMTLEADMHGLLISFSRRTVASITPGTFVALALLSGSAEAQQQPSPLSPGQPAIALPSGPLNPNALSCADSSGQL
jgi:hypothetical protein